MDIGYLIVACLVASLISQTEARKDFQQYFERTPDVNITTIEGLTVQIPCVVRHKSGDCYWLRNDKIVANIIGKYIYDKTSPSGDCGLTINNVKADSDDGTWECQVDTKSVDVQSLASGKMRLLILVPPQNPMIKRQMEHKRVLDIEAGRVEEIECVSAGGNPAAMIFWSIGSENITKESHTTQTQDEGKRTYTTRSILRLNVTRFQHNKTLTCNATHPTSNKIDYVQLNVRYAPVISISPSNFKLTENETVVYTCEADANPPGLIMWRDQYGKGTRNRDPHILNINPVLRQMNGQTYECSAENNVGVSMSKITLDVLYPPRILNITSDKSVVMGQSVALQCDSEGNPVPRISWLYVNPFNNEIERKESSDVQSNVLLINSVTYKDEGEYFCNAVSAINGNQVGDERHVLLDVHGPPSIFEDTSERKGIFGSKSTVSLHYCSDPLPIAVYWTFGSLKLTLQDSNDVRESGIQAQRYFVEIPKIIKKYRTNDQTCFESSFDIINTEYNDERQYTLHVVNQRGNSTGVVKLKVVNPVSAIAVIMSALIIVVIVSVISVVTLYIIRKKRKDNNVKPEEGKEPTQMLQTDKELSGHKTDQKTRSNELVYANLDFINEPKPQSRSNKPTTQQRTPNKGQNSTTEYAQLTFPGKADL